MATTIFYFASSFTSVLPWSLCPDDIEYCIDRDSNLSTLSFHINQSISSAESFYINEVTKRHPHGLDDGIFPPEWRLSLSLLAAWVLLFVILVKGVKSSGKAAYFTALFPYVVLFTLLGRGVTLEGAYNGIMFFITPQWDKLLTAKVWYAAVGQSFFSLNVGFGSIQMFASYNKFSHNVYRDATIISVIDTLTSLLAGFTIFAIMGHLAFKMGIDDIELILKGGGSGLAFVSYPDVLSRFDVVPQLFSVLFFLMLFTLGIGSASALTGCIITIICDEFPNFRRSYVTFVVCLMGFLLGLFYITPQGPFILDLVDFYGGTFIVFLLTIFEVIAIQYVYGYARFTRDIEFMLKRKTGIYWAFCWKFFIPLVLIVIFIYNLATLKPLTSGDYVFGFGANGFGLFITVAAIGNLPLCFCFTLYEMKKKSSSWGEALRKCFQPAEDWCPKDPILRKEYREFIQKHESHQLQGIDNVAAITSSTNGIYPSLQNYRSTEEF